MIKITRIGAPAIISKISFFIKYDGVHIHFIRVPIVLL